jgi:hypothetical protein
MEPADLFKQANEVLRQQIAEAARYEGHEAYEEAQAHVDRLSKALAEAQQTVTDATGKAKAAQADAAEAAAKARAATESARAAAASARTRAKKTTMTGVMPAPADPDVPFEDAQGLDPKKIRAAIHTLLHGRARTAAAEAAVADDRDIAEAWTELDIPGDSATSSPAPTTSAAPERKAPPPRTRRKPAPSPQPDEADDADRELWEEDPS